MGKMRPCLTTTLSRWHRIGLALVLCLFAFATTASAKPTGKREKSKEKVNLLHADVLRYDQYTRPNVQIVKGKVGFSHEGTKLYCDSAYFNQMTNTFEAFGHVRMSTPKGVTLHSDYAYYNGPDQMVMARRHVVLRDGGRVLYTDSLDYDRKFDYGYFFEGGRLIDGKNTLSSDWGEYDATNREARFYYAVRLKSPKYVIDTDTLFYDTQKKVAHVVGPSVINNEGNIVHTDNGYYHSETEETQLYGRSRVISKDKTRTIEGDKLFYDSKTGVSQGRGNVVYVDSKNQNSLVADYCYYNDKTGVGFAYDRAVGKEFSQGDTLFMHADTLLMRTYNIETDSAYRKVFAYNHVRAYRTDVQAVCDSLVFNSQDSCLTLYKDPILWNGSRQLLGEVITAYMNDSTVREAHVVDQALSVELMPDSVHYNQLSSRIINAYFTDGSPHEVEAIGNVLSDYYYVDNADSSIIGLNYLETDTLRMYMTPERKLRRIWTSQNNGVLYPLTQVPPGKDFLPQFVWFEYIRPIDKNDIFNWRGKADEQKLKTQKRRGAPRQKIGQQ